MTRLKWYREPETKHEADGDGLVVLRPDVDDGHGEGLPEACSPEPSVASSQADGGEEEEPEVVRRATRELDRLQVGRVLAPEVETEDEA